MALEAFRTLKFQIQNLIEKSPHSRFSLAPPTQQILQFAYEQVESSEEIAKRFLLSTTSRLDLEIKIPASKLLDIIQSLVKKHGPYRITGPFIEFSADEVEDLKQDVHSFADLFKKLRAREDEQEEKKDEDGENDAIPPKTKMVGFSDHYRELKDHLIGRRSFTPSVAVLVGMAGIGKTTLAREFFEEPDIEKRYKLRLWVKIGRKCRLSDIPRRILAKVSDSNLVEGDDEEIARRLGECLKGKKCLIVLDDVWNKYTAYHFRFVSLYKVFELHKFPYDSYNDEIRVLLTTRTQQVNEIEERMPVGYVLKMRFLNKEESWELLREKVFGEEPCPSHLEKAGQKIAENCKGLPLMIVKVAEILSREGNNTSECWNEVAARKNHQIFMDAYDKISEVLYPSYEILTQKLKMCFMYMVGFPQDSEIPQSKLVHMWNVDGFLETDVNKFQQAGPVECLNELVSNSLVMIYQTNLHPCNNELFKEEIKTCGLHSSFWHLSRREARNSKFCYVLVNPDDGFGEDMEGQRRLSFHNNVLFGFKDLRENVEDKCASSTRSLLCYGPYQQFQVRICFGLTRLRELDALAIRFYEFPSEVIQLLELRYLALTLNGAVPPSISKLSNLQTLIVGRHLSIRSRGEEACLPVEIWDMKELKHVQVMGSDFVHPSGAKLERLVTLSNVGARSCTEDFLIAIPKIQKLGIRIELAYYDDYEKLLSCLNHVCNLRELRSLKCVVLRSSGFVRPPAPFLNFSSRIRPTFSSWIRKLSLSGLGYPWEEMMKIALLPRLNVLKLRNYAFQGPKWEVYGTLPVHTLVIEDTDLAEWRIGHSSLRSLKRLSLKHCYRLKKIKWECAWGYNFHLAFSPSFRKIELVDCNPLGVEQMKKALPRWCEGVLVVHSSWNNPKP